MKHWHAMQNHFFHAWLDCLGNEPRYRRQCLWETGRRWTNESFRHRYGCVTYTPMTSVMASPNWRYLWRYMQTLAYHRSFYSFWLLHWWMRLFGTDSFVYTCINVPVTAPFPYCLMRLLASDCLITSNSFNLPQVQCLKKRGQRE